LKLTAKKPHESDDDNYYKYDKLYWNN
jgi:hypothetical protein